MLRGDNTGHMRHTREPGLGTPVMDHPQPPVPHKKDFLSFMVIFFKRDAGPSHAVSQKNEKNVTFTLKQAKKFFKQQGRWVVCLRVRWIDGMIVG